MQPLWRTVWKFLKKLKIELPYDPAIPRLGIYPGELKAGSQGGICISMVIGVLVTIAKTWQKPERPSTDEWIDKK